MVAIWKARRKSSAFPNATPLDEEERRNRCEELQQALNREVIPLSAVSKFNIEKVLYVLGDAVRRMKEDGRQAEAEPVSESQGWQP